MKDPLRHFGEGISELHRAILKYLPVTLQFPVFMIIMLIILVMRSQGFMNTNTQLWIYDHFTNICALLIHSGS